MPPTGRQDARVTSKTGEARCSCIGREELALRWLVVAFARCDAIDSSSFITSRSAFYCCGRAQAQHLRTTIGARTSSPTGGPAQRKQTASSRVAFAANVPPRTLGGAIRMLPTHLRANKIYSIVGPAPRSR